MYVPESCDPETPAGLLVFISPTDSGRMPGRYRQVLDEHNLIWIGAHRSETRRVHRAYRRANVDNVMLLEVAGMDHRMPPPEDLARAIAFLHE